MILLFNTPEITWTLTAVLLLSGSYHLWHVIRSDHLTGRINKSLHALMNVLMAAMLWNLAPSTMLAQIAVLIGATLWFLIQSVARPEFRTLCTGRQSRLKCVYHSVSMAGAALMAAMMAPVTTASNEIASTSIAASHVHHATTHTAPTHAAHGTAGTEINHSPNLAIMLTVFFAAAAVVSIVLLVRVRATRTTARNQATRHWARVEHGLEAIGAAVMALMFATMTT